MQLQPHFLFNALNTVAMLVRQGESQTAVRMLARLSDLLRALLDESGGQEVSLEEELDLLARYMEIEQVRFADRLTFRTEVTDDARGALVPAFLLQPLAENAVRHGIARTAAAAAIELRADRADGELRMCLHNDGPPLPADWSMDGYARIGLRNTAARLHHLYGAAGTLEVGNAAAGGVEVRITIPYHTRSALAARTHA
jgi:LytS/YehU family sensor histidine kinase